LPAAREEAERLLDLWEARYPLGQTPFWGVIRRGVRAELEPLLENEAARFPGFVVAELEGHHDLPRPDWGVHFSGIIDRVVRRGGALGVVDYKSSFRHALKSLIDADGRPFSYQMVLYILFLADYEGRVEQAVYYDFGKGRFIPFIDEETDREALFQILETDIREFVRRAGTGQFHPPRECDGCDFRFLCRKRYLVREVE
jgi:ATP-dependent exoDNAse (exonuclease V) beta subunit